MWAGEVTGMGKQDEAPATPVHNLVRLGDTIVLDKSCQSTASGVAVDFQALRWDTRKAMQYIYQRKQNGSAIATPEELKRLLAGTTLVGDEKHPGYATDSDLRELIARPHQSPAKFAENLMAERLALTPSTVSTYAKRGKASKARRASRRVPSPRKPVK